MTGKDLVHMLQGWGNLIVPSAARSEESKRNLKICDTCPHRKEYTCGSCGCVLIAKAMSDSPCPEGKW